VVENDMDVRQLSARILMRSGGYQVDAAEDGAAGWQALQAKNYHLLITDRKMPKLTGVEPVKI
jgi:DNA-binding response OmpR family regulator